MKVYLVVFAEELEERSWGLTPKSAKYGWVRASAAVIRKLGWNVSILLSRSVACKWWRL